MPLLAQLPQVPQLPAIPEIASGQAMEGLAPPIQVALFMAGLALLSTLLVCTTSFTRIVIVFSFVRRALTTQEIPPNPVLLGLALFMTWFIMGPAIDDVTRTAVQPYLAGEVNATQAWQAGSGRIKQFMLRHTRREDLALFISMSRSPRPESPQDTQLRVLIPAFVISELKTAFMMGFCIYIPFVLIDLVVSTVLMSLGMMMMPPVIMSLPFKVLLFVLVDGWSLVARALSASFAVS
jgi:flagellar biosynthetic protein FliP